ncbi:MAG: DMT family transporter [Halopenitus sp.]
MSRLRDVGMYTALALGWGTTFAAVEVALAAFPPLVLMAVRYYLAGAVLLGYVATTGHDWRPSTTGDLIGIAGGSVFWIALGNGVWFIGQALTTSVLSGLMAGLIPIATVVFSWQLLPEERLTPTSLVGLLVSFAGALLIVRPPGGFVVDSGFLGKAILLVGVAGSGLGSVLIRRAAGSITNTARTGWAVLFGAIIIHGLALLVGQGWPAEVTTSLGAVLYLALPATVVAYTCFFDLLSRNPAIDVTLVTYLVPIIPAITGRTLFGEPLTATMISGFVVVLVGFLLLKHQELRRELTRYRPGR